MNFYIIEIISEVQVYYIYIYVERERDLRGSSKERNKEMTISSSHYIGLRVRRKHGP